MKNPAFWAGFFIWWERGEAIRTVKQRKDRPRCVRKANGKLRLCFGIRGEIDVIVVGVDIGADQKSVDQGLLVQWIGQIPVGVVVQGCNDFLPGRQVGGAGFCHGEAGV